MGLNENLSIGCKFFVEFFVAYGLSRESLYRMWGKMVVFLDRHGIKEGKRK